MSCPKGVPNGCGGDILNRRGDKMHPRWRTLVVAGVIFSFLAACAPFALEFSNGLRAFDQGRYEDARLIWNKDRI